MKRICMMVDDDQGEKKKKRERILSGSPVKQGHVVLIRIHPLIPLEKPLLSSCRLLVIEN